MVNSLQQCFSPKTLEALWKREQRRLRKSCYGVDRLNGDQFASRVQRELRHLRERAASGVKPNGLLAISKPKGDGGHRIICVPTISDRLFQFAVLDTLRPKLEAKGLLNPVSYGLVRSAQRSVGHARAKAIALRNTAGWVLKADIVKFFDRIPRSEVVQICSKIVGQRSMQPAITPFINAEISDGFDPDWRSIVQKAGIKEGVGVRQGMPLSPYFAGMILLDLDRKIEKSGYKAIRYVDDIVGFFDAEQDCVEFKQFLDTELRLIGLNLGALDTKDTKTKIYAPGSPASFLGMDLVKGTNDKYHLQISQKCLEAISSKIAHAANIDFLLGKKITLTRLGSYLEAMKRGYTEAYKGAENLSQLEKDLSMQTKAVENHILYQVPWALTQRGGFPRRL